jgi:hypothetical protein
LAPFDKVGEDNDGPDQGSWGRWPVLKVLVFMIPKVPSQEMILSEGLSAPQDCEPRAVRQSQDLMVDRLETTLFFQLWRILVRIALGKIKFFEEIENG